ncbi:helix-turn-helix domain-containing protein [Nocardiopsis sediminis]|uniref:Helix-turn-helix domain-containing protein n=1 Tax=Nocardiopsis sediminis TaxID=1778267 RepID=A0ABV8FNL1_9ACTN
MIHDSAVSTAAHSPSLRLRRLACHLRRARTAAGLTTPQVAAAMRWSVGKISKMETTESKRIKPDDLDGLLDLYGIDDPAAREALHALARDARERGWWAKYRDVFKNEVLPDLEAEAAELRSFESQVVPGLLQTPAYAEAIFLGGLQTDPHRIRRRVEARMARREILTRFTPVRLKAVIDESVLHRHVGGPRVMAAQLTHLLNMARTPNVEVRVLTYDVGAHAALTAPFMILGFPHPADPTIVCVETLNEALYLDSEDDVRPYTATFDVVERAAADQERSDALIEDALYAVGRLR